MSGRTGIVIGVGESFGAGAGVTLAEGSSATTEGARVAIAEGAPVKSNENVIVGEGAGVATEEDAPVKSNECEPEGETGRPSSLTIQSCGSGKSPAMSLARFPKPSCMCGSVRLRARIICGPP